METNFVETKKLSAIEKSRINPNKTQEDYVRLFTYGTDKEASNIVHLLSVSSLTKIITSTNKGLSKRRRDNATNITYAFCDQDSGANWNMLSTPLEQKWEKYEAHVTIPYLIKADNFGVSTEFVLKVLEATRNAIFPLPDSFYDRHIAPLSLDIALNTSCFLSNEVLKRKTNEELVFLIKVFSGLKGDMLMLGWEIPTEKEFYYHIWEDTFASLPSAIYPEIKEYIPELKFRSQLVHMVIAHNDKEMAKELIGKVSDTSEYKLVNHFFSYEEKIGYLGDNVSKIREDVYGVLITEEEKIKAFKDSLETEGCPASVSVYLWEKARQSRYGFENKAEKEEVKRLRKEYLNILEHTSSPHFPLGFGIPRAIQIRLLKNGSREVENNFLLDFTRKEFLSYVSTAKIDGTAEIDFAFIKRTRPDLLTHDEIVEYGGRDNNFLKEHLNLFPKAFLLKRFPDIESKVKFIGPRLSGANKNLYAKLQSLIDNTNPY